MPHRRRILVLLLASVLLAPGASRADVDFSLIERWLATNSGVGSLRIDFTQTRTMRALEIPIEQTGTLWLDYGSDRFRWQTGDPPQTIVIGRGDEMVIMRTPRQRYERRRVGEGGGGGPGGVGALAGGFPRTVEEFRRKYRVLDTSRRDNTFRIVTRPRGESGRGVETFTFVVEAGGFRLLGMEIDLEDGSSVDTVFDRVQLNPRLPPQLFVPDLRGYTETEF